MEVTFCSSLIASCLLATTVLAEHRNDVCKSTKLGQEYHGSVSKTMSGRTCQRWVSQIPHTHSSNIFELDANFCRNPDKEPHGPWCYTMDPNVRWEYCGIPCCDICDEESVSLMLPNATTGRSNTTDVTVKHSWHHSVADHSYLDDQVNQSEALSVDEVRESDVGLLADTSTQASPVKVKTPWHNATVIVPPVHIAVQEFTDNQSLALSEDDVEEAPGAVYIGSFGVIMIILFVSFLVILDLTTFYDNLRYLYENLQDFWGRKPVYV